MIGEIIPESCIHLCEEPLFVLTPTQVLWAQCSSHYVEDMDRLTAATFEYYTICYDLNTSRTLVLSVHGWMLVFV